MRKKTIFKRGYLLLSVYFLLVCCYGQHTKSTNFKPLNIGDTVPDIVLTRMINAKNRTAKFSDFKGKAILLDFWATWCVPCVASFPKLEKLQREFADDLKIILISNDHEASIQNFYSQRRDLILPTAVLQEPTGDLNMLFPHRSLPHYIWIDKNKRLVGITNAGEISETNFKDLIAGKLKLLPIKNDSSLFGDRTPLTLDSIELVGGRIKRISIDSGTLFMSKFRRFDERLTQTWMVNFSSSKAFNYIQQVNCSIIHLYQTAFLGIGNDQAVTKNHILVDMADTTLDYPATNNLFIRKNWQIAHSYSYYLISQGRLDSLALFQRMQKDLVDFFGIKTKFRKERMKTLVLKKLPGFDKRLILSNGDTTFLHSSVYGIKLKNQPLKKIFDILETYGINRTQLIRQPNMPFIDKTNIDYPVDIQINANILNLNEVNDELAKYGLTMVAEEHKVNSLILFK